MNPEDLLQPRHPLEQPHHAQLAALRSLPDSQRAAIAQLFRLGNAAYCYQQQVAGEVTEADYRHWLEGLPPGMRQAMERDGFEKSKSCLPLRRHALERRDIGYNAFMESVLCAEDWAAWLDQKAQQRSAGGSPSRQ